MKKEVEVTHVDLWDEIKNLSVVVGCLGHMVQNDYSTMSKEELLSWAHDVNEVISRLDMVKKDVIRYYLDK